MTKLDLTKVAESAKYQRDDIGSLQVAVYTMAGGGMLGRLAAEQPADFYIDDRCGRLPYSRREITQAVTVLATLAKALGLDPCKMPEMPDFHCCGVF